MRICFPERDCHLYPTVEFGGIALRIHDISIGGCCLIDPFEAMGSSIGNEIILTLHWPDGSNKIRSRIVARVDHRRHIQFLNIPQKRIEDLKFLISPASRGLNIVLHKGDLSRGPILEAREIWSSYHGDHIVIEDHHHRLCTIGLFRVTYTLFRNAWPVKEQGSPLTKAEVHSLILFLCNINQPSNLLKEIQLILQGLSFEGAK